jgi:hypothetical protein
LFLNDLFLGLLAALILVLPVTLITAIGTKHLERTLLVAGGVVVAYGFFNWFDFWWGTPTIGFTKIAIYHEYWRVYWAVIIAGVVIGLAAAEWKEGSYSSSGTPKMPTIGSVVMVGIALIMAIYGIANQGLWTGGRANTLAHEAHAVFQQPNQYPDTDANHILQVPEQTADFLANQVLASSSDKRLSTIYEVGDGVLQSIDRHLYWIYGLAPTGYRNSNKVPNAEVPAIVVVDAENPNAHPYLRLKDALGQPYHLKYYIGGYHWHSLSRFLWSHGYRDQVVRDPTLELDDQWRPFYTASLESPTVNFNNDVPSKALVINAETGQTSTYRVGKSLAPNEPVQLPSWIDRIYDVNDVRNMLNWWGEWGQASYNLFSESSANRYQVAGDPVLVYTTGGHPVWQAILTSYSKDTAAAYLALFDARDNEVKIYSIPGLTLANVAEHVILGSSKNLKNLQPVHMTLHKIYGQLTWVAPLIRDNSGDNSDGSGVTGSAQQGIALLPYNETNGDNVVIANDMPSALTQYRTILANGGTSGGVDENANNKTIEGMVTQLSEVVESGQTVFYFTLGHDTAHVYRAAQQSNGSTSQNLELPFIKVGSKVRLTYLDTGSARRDVGAFDLLNLQVASSS